jgi:hypothetical protein
VRTPTLPLSLPSSVRAQSNCATSIAVVQSNRIKRQPGALRVRVSPSLSRSSSRPHRSESWPDRFGWPFACAHDLTAVSQSNQRLPFVSVSESPSPSLSRSSSRPQAGSSCLRTTLPPPAAYCLLSSHFFVVRSVSSPVSSLSRFLSFLFLFSFPFCLFHLFRFVFVFNSFVSVRFSFVFDFWMLNTEPLHSSMSQKALQKAVHFIQCDPGSASTRKRQRLNREASDLHQRPLPQDCLPDPWWRQCCVRRPHPPLLLLSLISHF